MPTPPVILIGMHRSGTTLLARLLEDLGVFLGRGGGSNREAKLFKLVNKWLFVQVGATRDQTKNAAYLYSEELRPHVDHVLRLQTRGLPAARYLGPVRAVRYHDLQRLDFPWAWKDPRNCFTVGLWKRVFPDAKVVHIYRHPLDVANSLKRREEKRLHGFRRTLGARLFELALVRKQIYCQSVALFDPLEGVAVWEAYVNAAFQRCRPFEHDTLHCRYETLLARPEETLAEIADFIAHPSSPEAIRRATRDVNPARGFAWEKDASLVELMDEIAGLPLVEKLGYATRSGSETASGGAEPRP